MLIVYIENSPAKKNNLQGFVWRGGKFIRKLRSFNNYTDVVNHAKKLLDNANFATVHAADLDGKVTPMELSKILHHE